MRPACTAPTSCACRLPACRCLAQGIARHSDADRLSLVEEELGSLSELLGEQPYLFGAR